MDTKFKAGDTITFATVNWAPRIRVIEVIDGMYLLEGDGDRFLRATPNTDKWFRLVRSS